jgi:LemA protein
MDPILIFLGLLAAAALFGAMLYNRLITLRNRYKNSFSQISVQLQRRYDLIPNLVETAKGYMTHERETLEAVTSARNMAVPAAKKAAENPGDLGALRNLAGAEGVLTAAMGKLFAVAESYPELKADKTMMALMEELSSTENKVGFARQAYNDAVTDYNTAREVFPSVVIAGMFAFGPAELLELEDASAKKGPKVKF